MILTEKEWIVSKPEDEVAQNKKGFPKETEEIKTTRLNLAFLVW